VVSTTLQLLYLQERGPVPILQDAEWASRLDWMGEENLVPTGILTVNHPILNESLYLVHYPGCY
jgi:hypothetical protein